MDDSVDILPDPPAALRERLASGAAVAWRQPVTMPTYAPAEPERYPMFLERRVYQGASGRVYPLPFVDGVADRAEPRSWEAIHLENRWLRLMVMPELGGRVHVAWDKTAGYDLFYRNRVIKPALVGLAGPWISGGLELNWPQHHRPTTFLPVAAQVEEHEDGAVTVWCSDHDPFARMKGMHGIRLHPDLATLELVVRLHNRTEDVQTVMWWANVAARAHDGYQSFFPTDVRHVADHARRAITAFPRADRPYYGIDYPARVTPEDPEADRLDLFRNIPVPTSYMVLETQDDFFGGYDHHAQAGFVHWADRRIAPGKKQWTWGNAAFGQAWDRQLTDEDGPYVELMAGVFTDNQPDFSFLRPGETRTFSQYWFPIHRIGPAHQATRETAVSLTVADGVARVGVASARELPGATVRLERAVPVQAGADGAGPTGDGVEVLATWAVDLAPGAPLVETCAVPAGLTARDVVLVVEHAGHELLRWTERPDHGDHPEPAAATRPPEPAEVASQDELYLTGLHLEQYRHPTVDPRAYWLEGLRRDPGDARINVALGAARHRDGDYAGALAHLETALARLTARNPNPADGEASYRRGLALARLGRAQEAYDAFAKAAWDGRWAHAAHLQMAFLDAAARRDRRALEVVGTARRLDSQDLRARALEVALLRRLGREQEADERLAATLALDPLDPWNRDLAGLQPPADARVLVDVALDHAASGETARALALLSQAATVPAGPAGNAAPCAHYLAALLLDRAGRGAEAEDRRRLAREVEDRYAFPAGLDDHDALLAAVQADPTDLRALALLGMWLYDRRRPVEALGRFRQALEGAALAGGSRDPVLLRNAAVALVNTGGDEAEAADLYDRAVELAPQDARLWVERDQLARRRGVGPAERLAALAGAERHLAARDDLLVERAELLTAVGRAREARALVTGRPLHPWEGGEGRALGAFTRACLAIAREGLEAGASALHEALEAADVALDPPRSLGEARHALDSVAEVHLVRGDVLAAAGRGEEARAAWRAASRDVAAPEVTPSRQADRGTCFVAVAAARLGDEERAGSAWAAVRARVAELEAARPTTDYFATSLPAMLLFVTDPADAVHHELADLRALLEHWA